MKIIIIAAIAENGVIGKANGEMPWHIREEFAHFKESTMGFPVIMGRKTFQTLGKPLKGRLNIVVSSVPFVSENEDTFMYMDSLEECIQFCRNRNFEKIFIIGGGSIYRQTLHIADEMILSHMKFKAEGEVTFPEFDTSDWLITNKVDREQFTIFYYLRKAAA